MHLSDRLSYKTTDSNNFNRSKLADNLSYISWSQVKEGDILKIHKNAYVDAYLIKGNSCQWLTLIRDGTTASVTYDNTSQLLNSLIIDSDDCLQIIGEGVLWIRSKDITHGKHLGENLNQITLTFGSDKGFLVQGNVQQTGAESVVQVSDSTLILNSPNQINLTATLTDNKEETNHFFTIAGTGEHMQLSTQVMRINNPKRLLDSTSVSLTINGTINVGSTISQNPSLRLYVDGQEKTTLLNWNTPGFKEINSTINVGLFIPITANKVQIAYINGTGNVDQGLNLNQVTWLVKINALDGITDTLMAFKDGDNLIIKSDTIPMVNIPFVSDQMKAVFVENDEWINLNAGNMMDNYFYINKSPEEPQLYIPIVDAQLGDIINDLNIDTSKQPSGLEETSFRFRQPIGVSGGSLRLTWEPVGQYPPILAWRFYAYLMDSYGTNIRDLTLWSSPNPDGSAGTYVSDLEDKMEQIRAHIQAWPGMELYEIWPQDGVPESVWLPVGIKGE